MPFVLDASVALSWYFGDEFSEYAAKVESRLRSDGAIAPSIWPLEMANGLLAAERRGRLSNASLSHAARLLLSLPVIVVGVTTALALGSVLDVARQQELSSYDAAYLELAMREGLPLATLDDRLRAAAHSVGVTLVS